MSVVVDLAQPQAIDLAQPAGSDLLTSHVDLAQPLPDLSVMQQPDMAQITGCQLVPQSGCPANMKCTTHDGKTTVCDPVGGQARGTVCTSTLEVDNCAAGSVCIDESRGTATMASQCRAFCVTTADCGSRSYCDFTIGNFGICTQPCNAIYPGTGCETGLGCFVIGDENTDCELPGAGTNGSGCTTDNDCTSGEACIGNTGATACRPVCNINNSAGCNANDLCYGVQDGNFTWPDYGVCCPFAGC